MESSWSALKTELLPHGTCFTDLKEAHLDHYNDMPRLHSALCYCPHSKLNSNIFSVVVKM
jgi:hypothetical protein